VRILTVAESLDGIGGLERAQLQACRELRDRGHEIDLLYVQGGDLTGAWDAVATRRIRVDGYALHRRAPLRTARSVYRVATVVRRMAPDVVYHRHAFAPALTRRPVVCHMHLPPPSTGSVQERFGLGGARAFISVSRYTADQWTEHLGVSPGRFAIVPNGVDTDRFRPLSSEQRRSVRATHGLPPDRFLVLYAARIDAGKGIDRALDAMRLLPPTEYHLALAGAPNPADFGGDAVAGAAYERELRSSYADIDATWLGRVGDMPPLLAAADVVVLPSRYPDPLPLLVLETLASGTPILASAVGGIPEMLTGALESQLVPDGDAAALAQRIRRLRNWRTEQPDLAAIGRDHVERNYSLARMGSQVNAALGEALTERQR
jgi:glycosyltransferase involved in cell wall biosynthesis